MRYIRILYIDSEVDEKEACMRLEEAISSLKDNDCIGIFTVVPNIFAALEYTNRMKFDFIMIDINVSNLTIALSEMEMNIPKFLSVNFEDSVHLDMKLIKNKGFKGIMMKPFNSEQLCLQIKNALNIDDDDVWTQNTSKKLLKIINGIAGGKCRRSSACLSEKSENLLNFLEDYAS